MNVTHQFMRRTVLLAVLALLPSLGMAQEVLLPLRHASGTEAKSATRLSLPFFDDFSSKEVSAAQWLPGSALVNDGYAPQPPTVGMVTLDAFDADGRLYASELGQLYSADTLASQVVRLDSAFSPVPRALGVADSVYLSFFYLPGGGYGNRWEGVGDVPESADSLVLEFFDASSGEWRWVWSRSGISADTLFSRTGSYWQYCEVLIDDMRYFNADFQFRFRNYCSLDVDPKKGLLSNADQWNIDYVVVDAQRHRGDSVSRDLAFVNPAASMLRNYTAMPACQYVPGEMRPDMELLITNRFSNELAANYGYKILDEVGTVVHDYDGGFENAPVYWNGAVYQTAAAHANPRLDFAFPAGMTAPTTYTIVHGLREGVSGDPHPQNDTIAFRQVFDNYYAYDDGSAENGYGLTSTTPKVKLAYRFDMNVADTLTAVYLYFNHTFREQNADVRFYITVWDDADGHPGNVIYKDENRRGAQFGGLNKYMRYVLERPVECQGTIYVGVEQTTADYLNLGFDRNNDASDRIFYLTGNSWQRSILRGALMLRPYFGTRATLGIGSADAPSEANVQVRGGRIVIDQEVETPVAVYDAMGRRVFACTKGNHIVTDSLPRGIYLVKLGAKPAKKVIVL